MDDYIAISDWIEIKYRDFADRVDVASIYFEYGDNNDHSYCLPLTESWKVVTIDGEKMGTDGNWLYESDEYPDVYVQMDLDNNRARAFKRRELT